MREGLPVRDIQTVEDVKVIAWVGSKDLKRLMEDLRKLEPCPSQGWLLLPNESK